MRLSIIEIALILDTLVGSLSIDDDRVFKYDRDSRQRVVKHIIEQTNVANIKIEDEE